jgi:Fic family protein
MLAGIGETLPNPHLLIEPYLRREAVLSSRIEGTQASISDVLLYEAADTRRETRDAWEVVNYVRALELGLSLLDELPVCARLTKSIHARLLEGVRGQEKNPGEFRSDQVWIGAPGTPIEQARYIPPPSPHITDLFSDWERFVNEDLTMPPLVRCGIMHYQFEAIHPFSDGNGRVGRLLIILYLCSVKVLPTPLLYLSAYFDSHRDEYYDRLFQVSASGAWEGWLKFFLTGVATEATDAIIRSRRLRELHEAYRERLQQQRASGNLLRLLDYLFINPYITVPRARSLLGVSRPGAALIVDRLEDAGIIDYESGSWPKVYLARELLRLLEAPTGEV